MNSVVRREGVLPLAPYLIGGLFCLALVAFWPRYLSQLGHGTLNFYKHFHALMMTLWFALLIAQPILIRQGNRPLHRMLGRLSFVIAPLAVLSMIFLTHHRLKPLDEAGLNQVGIYAILPLSMALVFSTAYGLAIRYRKQMALHARYMLSTAFALIDPVGARLLGFYAPPLPDWAYQGTTFTVTDIILLWLIWRERKSTSGRSAFPVMLGVMLVCQFTTFALPHVSGWLQIVRWFRDLPLT